MQIHGVLETCLYVDDLRAAEQFYQDVLGLTLFSRKEGRHAFFRCGRGMLLLFLPHASRAAAETPPHGAEGPGHVAFAVRSPELDAWKARLAAGGVSIECSHQWPHGGISHYFRDPAGNSLELASPAIWSLPEPAD